jgi:hypothetical protein
MNNAKVSIISPMLTLLTQEDVHYKPDWHEVELMPETGDPKASMENVRRLSGEGLTYMGMVAGPGGVVLQFQTGESILLTGFALGGGPKTEALAAAAHGLGLGDQDELALWYTNLGQDYRGPIPR